MLQPVDNIRKCVFKDIENNKKAINQPLTPIQQEYIFSEILSLNFRMGTYRWE